MPSSPLAEVPVVDFLTVSSSATIASLTVTGNFSAPSIVISSSQVDFLGVSSAFDTQTIIVSCDATIGSSVSAFTVNSKSPSYPNLPAFMAISSAAVSAATGDNTAYTVLCMEKRYDRTTAYTSNTGIFTAPVAGIYAFSGSVGLTGLTSNHTTARVQVVIGTTVTLVPALATYSSGAGITALNLPWSLQAELAATDTVKMQAVVLGASKGVAVAGSTSTPPTWFAGYLVG